MLVHILNNVVLFTNSPFSIISATVLDGCIKDDKGK